MRSRIKERTKMAMGGDERQELRSVCVRASESYPSIEVVSGQRTVSFICVGAVLLSFLSEQLNWNCWTDDDDDDDE